MISDLQRLTPPDKKGVPYEQWLKQIPRARLVDAAEEIKWWADLQASKERPVKKGKK